MKKLTFALSLCGLFVFSSCGGSLASQMADAFCKCAKMEGEAAQKCESEAKDKFKPQVEKLDDSKKMEFAAEMMKQVAAKCPDAATKLK